MKKRKGAAIIYAIFISTAVFLIGLLIVTKVGQNIKSTKRIREFSQAYYVTISGLEMGGNALMAKGVYNGEEASVLLEKFKADPSKILKDTYKFPSSNDYVDIKIYTVDKDGNKFVLGNPPEDMWVQISATGTAFNAGDNPTTHSGLVRYKAQEPAVFIKEVNKPSH